MSSQIAVVQIGSSLCFDYIETPAIPDLMSTEVRPGDCRAATRVGADARDRPR